MNKKFFALLVLTPLILVGCSKSNDSSQGPSSHSSESSETVLPDAPIDEITLSLANFSYSEVLPTPEITGLTAENVQVSYSYHNRTTGDKLGDYVAGGAAGSINAGEYSLKANVTSSTYKPFELSTNFAVSKSETMPIDFVAYDYYYDDVKPEPLLEVPAGSEVSLKYYHLSAEKHEYVPGSANDILPGSYTLEATIENPNYVTKVETYGFVVLKAQFDSAYSLQGANIDVGVTDIGFSLNDVDLNSILSMKVVATDATLEDVTFTWKQEYEFDPGTPLSAKVIAHKEYFDDKEFDVTVTGSKKEVAKPTYNCSTTFYYDGVEHSVTLSNFDEDRMEILEGSVSKATDAGEYAIKVGLKDKVHNKWADGTTDDLNLAWEIRKNNPAGSSTGYRLSIGDFVSGSSDVTVYVDKSILASPATLKYEFRKGSEPYSFSEYEFAQYEAYPEGTAHIDEDGKLVVDDLDAEMFYITVSTSNPNHYFSQGYRIYIVDHASDTERTLNFDAQHTTASYYGLDSATIKDCEYHYDYITSLSAISSGFKIDNGKHFKAVKTIKMKFHFPEECTYLNVNPFFSENDSNVSDSDNVSVAQILDPSDEAFDESAWVEFDFTSKTFADDTEYYLFFWFSGSQDIQFQVTDIQIVYDVM